MTPTCTIRSRGRQQRGRVATPGSAQADDDTTSALMFGAGDSAAHRSGPSGLVGQWGHSSQITCARAHSSLAAGRQVESEGRRDLELSWGKGAQIEGDSVTSAGRWKQQSDRPDLCPSTQGVER